MPDPKTGWRRARRMVLAAALSPLATVVVVAQQETFHSGGVGSCGGCHVTHRDGVPPAGPLLADGNPTDLCLRCHETDNGNSWGASLTVPGPIFGGGQFVFLLEDNLNDGPGGNSPGNQILGHQAGHNVISARKGTAQDPIFAESPGGNYPSDNLHCTSCHDPHGRGGHYRLLYGSDYPDAVVNGRTFSFTKPAPDATGISLHGLPESETNHNAYRSGISEWCGNCHGDYHDAAGSANLEHPSDETLGGDEGNSYNTYSGNGMFTGNGLTAYLAMVPIEWPASTTDFRGPIVSGSRVTCLSCHRAHASSAPRSGRWDFYINTWADEGTRSGSWPIPNPFEATAGPAQGQLCEKCHGPNSPSPPPPRPGGSSGGSTFER